VKKILVLKFGGSSLSDSEKILFVAQKIAYFYKKKHKVCAILSAPADITDNLISLSKSKKFKIIPRELDALISCGEQISIALMAMALKKINISAISLNSFQIPICGSGKFQNGKIREINAENIKKELRHKVVLIPGFQAINEKKEIITLGRGGSDLSAIAMAHFLKADSCVLFTDVDGVYSANPSIIPDAVKLTEISSQELMNLAKLGLEVRQLKSLEFARKEKVDLYLSSTISKGKGTLISYREPRDPRINIIFNKDKEIFITGYMPYKAKDFNLKIKKLTKNKIKISKYAVSFISDFIERDLKKAHDLFITESH